MKRREVFVAARQRSWSELDALLGSVAPKSGREVSRIAALYRQVCADLATARAHSFGLDLISHLDALASRGHNMLYASRARRTRSLHRLLLHEFPRTVRAYRRFFMLSAILFLLPLGVGFFGALNSQEFAMKVVPSEALEQLAESYSQGFADGQNAGTDTLMTGFYVYNNVGVAFRCFATGILFGLGSVFFLVYNGLAIGAVAGHVTASGSGAHLLSFVSGHSAFELTAIVIAGAAGLRMGYALVDTQGMSRLASLRSISRELVAVLVGTATMLAAAAVIEGFWSPSSIPNPVKWAFGITGWLVVGLFLALSGRQPERNSA